MTDNLVNALNNAKRSTHSDIYEHLPVLEKYSTECSHITEMGVRAIVSTYAFIAGLPKTVISIDIKHPDDVTGRAGLVDEVIKIAADNGVDFKFVLGSTLDIDIEETDLLFIDTLHTYNQLKAELSRHGNKSRKYIILHDTVTFGEVGQGGQAGLLPAVEEFINETPHWQIFEHLTNNNGLMILKRV